MRDTVKRWNWKKFKKEAVFPDFTEPFLISRYFSAITNDNFNLI